MLPPDLPAGRIAARFGLVSDTHMPERCPALPPSLFRVLEGVDLVLHAGDVGELWVLDQLSAIAPVVAVHGNDDSPDAQRELPYGQIVAAAGARVLLCHTHFPDPADEAAWRQSGGPPEAALARRAAMARSAGAGVLVYGHTHVPMAAEYEGVWLVNPGAIASANAVTRMRYQTVALLYLRDDGAPFVVHVDLAAPEEPFAPEWWTGHDWRQGVRGLAPRFTGSVFEPDLDERWRRAWERVRGFPADERRAVDALLCRLAYPCWAGEQAHVTRTELLDAVRAEAGLSDASRDEILAALTADGT